MIDPRIDIELSQPFVDVACPALAPCLDQFGAVPVAHLLAEPVFAYLAHGEHDMGMRLGETVRAHIPMDIEVGDHAAIHELGPHKVPGKLDTLLLVQFVRDRELDLARELRVLAQFGCLDLVPQGRAVAEPFGRTLGQHHFGMDDTRLVGEVVRTIQSIIVEPLGGTVGGGGHRARSRAARNDFCREMVDRHDGNPVTANKRRRHDV